MDMISNLPDDLNDHIISFLSTKEATCLKYASKNWLNLVKKFYLKLRSLDFSHYKTINDRLRNVLNGGVLDLELDISLQGYYSLPFEIFTCKSVVNLKLGSGFVIGFLPKNALLPALKTLHLDSVRLDGAFERLLSACPVLEELVIDGFNCELWNWSHTVYSQILKRLTIRRSYSDDSDFYQDHEFKRISFDTPSLVYLEYNDYIHDEFPVVNLNSLVEAKLNFNLTTLRGKTDPTNLFKGLKNVQILRLDGVDTGLLLQGFSEAAPMFENMSHLFMSTEPDVCWEALRIFVERSPNLKFLTIEELHYAYQKNLESVCQCLDGYSFLLSCPIEILKITMFQGQIGEMVQIKLVLENLQCLVLLEVHVEATSDEEKQQIMADILMLPRASPNCEVEFKFV